MFIREKERERGWGNNRGGGRGGVSKSNLVFYTQSTIMVISGHWEGGRERERDAYTLFACMCESECPYVCVCLSDVLCVYTRLVYTYMYILIGPLSVRVCVHVCVCVCAYVHVCLSITVCIHEQKFAGVCDVWNLVTWFRALGRYWGFL